MFTMCMPVTFKIGDTADVKINGYPKRLTWRDTKTLVIEPDDVRTIFDQWTDGELIHFTCGNAADEPQGPFTITRPGKM